jgi:APA family basic amino acid/polyamine antiporter
LGSSAPRTDTGPARRLRPWAATAMVISQVVGVGIFLTPAAMMRTLGSATAALAVWAVIGTLSIAGALVYAELTTRFPKAGGGYVFLREAFGPRSAFVFGWMALLVTDPGITAALGIGLAQYLLAATAGSQALAPYVAIAAIWAFALLTFAGIGVSAAVLRWTAVAKLVIVAVLVGAGALRASSGSSIAGTAVATDAIGVEAWAGAVMAAFFAFGGWWELGRMSEEVESPSRTMPRALVGGLAIVTGIYALISLAYVLAVSGQRVEGTDEAFVSIVGNALFGPAAARLLAIMVVIAVSGSLAATLLAAPRMYLAMARDGLFPERLARFDERRGASPVATIIQVSLASLLIAVGSFDAILGYFVPTTVFFLGLSAAAVLRIPRPAEDGRVFRAPLHPLPIALFLTLIVVVLGLFIVGQPAQALLGAAVAALGIPASFLVLRERRRSPAKS